MSFQPLILGTGLSAWIGLQTGLERQWGLFAARPDLARDADRFQERIAGLTSPEALVADRTALKVALGAYDLGQDIDSRFFIRRILEGGSTDASALANRLQDSRYKELARGFGQDRFDLGLTRNAAFVARTIDKYTQVAFEQAVGEQDADLRLSLGFKRLMPEIAASTASNDAAWFKVMANPPLRKVWETVFGLPQQFGQIDLDKQLEVFKTKAESGFGTDRIAELATGDTSEQIVRRFLLRSQVNAGAALDSRQVALTLMSQIQVPDLLP
ncbi:DUF1217 domain-containing protein [Mesobacterium sp. TK19101]|uniref:DUF1217 domain-containing protein n=1 Tax=Mesobacterium hydrothermale TaxID=3111907 RepID=A0ABU6HH25_9RHOB|nr:DUF1217 domain-containing protein [Mesobacterium sp. TK19101]MEC3861626.1 DUF1217 domain-containing protein [Mesobacterium sp. TK19101]